MSDPHEIYLQPECCADPDTGRLWCEDNAPVDCEDGTPWTKYVLADALAAQAKEIEALRKDAERWRMLPAFLSEYQIDYLKLLRDTDAAIDAAKGEPDAPNLPDSETRGQIMALIDIYEGRSEMHRAALRAAVERVIQERDALMAQFKGTGHVPYLERMRQLAERAERAEREAALARDGWHQANGVADLAMKHRNAAEQEVAELSGTVSRLLIQLQHAEQEAGECSGGYQTLEKEVAMLKQEAAALRELLGEARHFVRERGSDPALLARIDAALKP